MKNSWASRLLASASDLIFPHNCLLCRGYISNGDSVLCLFCAGGIAHNTPPFCRRCSRHLSDPDPGQAECRECRENEQHFTQAWSACLYTTPLRRLIHLFKYAQKTALRHTFSQWMISFIERYHLPVHQFDVLVPIPLHKARLRERGYNQAELLTELIAGKFQLRRAGGNLLRIRHTPNQALLNKKERWTNIQAAFKIRHPSEFTGKSVLLIDDLLTTGATLSEAARVLKAAGATQVAALTLAIAP